jgi:valyl-tRNA synthetase
MKRWRYVFLISIIKAVRSGKLEIAPQASEKEWFRWLENNQDWCISRQLWWGHRIPAYYVSIKGDETNVI